jgi:2-dehydropantoate 2-reductase
MTASAGPRTVAILGPGAVGGALAVPLAIARQQVVCVAREETAEAITRDGLTLVRRGEEFHAHPSATDVLRDDVDLLLIAVKAPSLDDALDRIQASAATIVPLLNGLEHVSRIRARFDGRVVAGSIGLLEAYREAPTRIVQTTRGPVISVADPVEIPAFDVRVVGDERRLLWEKAARMAPLAAATAATQRSVGDLRTDPEWRSRLALAIEEACATATADGVPLSPSGQWEVIDAMPDAMTTSTARDVAARRPSELDAITGSVVRAARRLHVPAPTLEQLLEEAWRA